LSSHGVDQVGVEGSASWGSHVAIAVVAAGFDAREVPPVRAAQQRRARRLAKTDTVDAVATARALLAEPSLGPVQALEGTTRWWPRSKRCSNTAACWCSCAR
jgi:2,4-dienoyl-CoA reductase-like NADH-dependent reductase (Old Yellow Enzyme family)